MNLNEMHDYWKSRGLSGENGIKLYLKGAKKSIYLQNIFKFFNFDKNFKILELGCNVGRNLDYLSKAGYTRLTGIDINPEAISLGKDTFPHLRLINSSLEKYFSKPRKFDIIFSMAVLEHINPESDWIFEKILASAKIIITLEYEGHTENPRLVQRNYYKVFNNHNVSNKNIFQILEEKVEGIKPLEGYTLRIFSVS